MTDPFAPPTGEPSAPTPIEPPPFGEPLRGPQRNGLGVASLVLGLVSLPLGVILPLPLLAIGLGIAALRRTKRGEATNSGVAIAGVLTGAVGLLFGIGVIALAVWVARSPAYDQFQVCDERATTAEAQNACLQELGRELFD